jgi:hypothetical protein
MGDKLQAIQREEDLKSYAASRLGVLKDYSRALIDSVLNLEDDQIMTKRAELARESMGLDSAHLRNNYRNLKSELQEVRRFDLSTNYNLSGKKRSNFIHPYFLDSERVTSIMVMQNMNIAMLAGFVLFRFGNRQPEALHKSRQFYKWLRDIGRGIPRFFIAVLHDRPDSWYNEFKLEIYTYIYIFELGQAIKRSSSDGDEAKSINPMDLLFQVFQPVDPSGSMQEYVPMLVQIVCVYQNDLQEMYTYLCERFTVEALFVRMADFVKSCSNSLQMMEANASNELKRSVAERTAAQDSPAYQSESDDASEGDDDEPIVLSVERTRKVPATVEVRSPTELTGYAPNCTVLGRQSDYTDTDFDGDRTPSRYNTPKFELSNERSTSYRHILPKSGLSGSSSPSTGVGNGKVGPSRANLARNTPPTNEQYVRRRTGEEIRKSVVFSFDGRVGSISGENNRMSPPGGQPLAPTTMSPNAKRQRTIPPSGFYTRPTI